MIHNYSKFVNINKFDILNEGSEKSPQIIYWSKQFEDIKDITWTEISTYRHNSDKYIIKFKAGDGKYDYFGIIVDHSNGSKNEIYYLENTNLVMEKLKNDFWKNPSEYITKLKYKPSAFGDLSHIIDALKFNI